MHVNKHALHELLCARIHTKKKVLYSGIIRGKDTCKVSHISKAKKSKNKWKIGHGRMFT
jgi:hypothetical protein